MNQAAYNYETQRWTTGQEAANLRREQLNQELALLTSPRGAEYLRFTGARVTLEQALANVRAKLAAL